MYYYQHDGGIQGIEALFSIMTLRYNGFLAAEFTLKRASGVGVTSESMI